MASTRPMRTSARQSAIRQQEQEVAEAKEAERRQKIALRMEQLARQKEEQEQQERERALASSSSLSSSSSRSLSPALSDSGDSLSSGGSDDDDEDENSTADANGSESQTQRSKRSTGPSVAGVSSSWEIALVYGFLTKFRSLLRQTCPLHEYSIEDLEAGLEATSSNACIEEIHANLLSNMLNRKKAVDAQTWQKVLMETLDAKQKTGELEYDVNPLRFYNNYYNIPSPDRIQLLRALVDWVLQEGTIIRQGIEQDNRHYVVEPFGTDQSRRVYWYFGEGTLRVYRETKSAKKKNNDWETVASTIEELKLLADSFKGTSYKAERALRERICTEIIEPMEERVLQNKLKQERLEKRMHRLAELHQIAATRTTRTRSSNRINAPKYTFDDEEDFEEEDEFAMYRRPSSRRRLDDDSQDVSGPQPTGEQSQPSQGTDQNPDQKQDQPLERSESVEPALSARSSVGHDSDTSIRVALQRTRVGDAEDDEEEDAAAAVLTRTGGWVSDHGQMESDRDGDHHRAETDMLNGNSVPSVAVEIPALESKTTATATTMTTTTMTPAPHVAEDATDVEMQPATA
ncbi:cat eye syndrome chromosome region, candidate 2 [Mortierella alpina]|nr:cat eye syndrome chromosome region, candidate 2 [Mortierella alpina]